MFIGRGIITVLAALFAKGANGNLSEYLDDLKNNMEKIAEHVKKVKWLNRLRMVQSLGLSIFVVVPIPIFSLLSLNGNKRRLPSMKVIEMEKFWNKMG